MSVAGMIYDNLTSRFPPPHEGMLRVWWIPQLPGKEFEWIVPDELTAHIMLNALAAYDDFQLANRIKPDYSNTGGLSVFRGGEWEDWENEHAESFDDYRARVFKDDFRQYYRDKETA